MGKLIVALYGYGECPSKREKKGKEEGKGGRGEKEMRRITCIYTRVHN